MLPVGCTYPDCFSCELPDCECSDEAVQREYWRLQKRRLRAAKPEQYREAQRRQRRRKEEQEPGRYARFVRECKQRKKEREEAERV